MRIIKPDSRFNPITVDEFYDSPNDDCRIVCLSSREVTIIRKMLIPAYWPTRFGFWVNDRVFQTADNGELVEALEILEGSLMADCGIGDGLQAIANSIELLAKSQCCDSTDVVINVNGGINGSLPDGTVTYGTEPYSDAPSGVPEGYEDAEQFESQKCAMANQMVSDCVYVLSVLSGASGISAIGGLVVTVLGVMAIIAVPQVAIPTLIAVVATAFLASGVLYAVSLEVESHRQDIVCALISGDNLDLIMETLSDIFDVIIANVGASSPVGVAVKTILMILFNSETVNKLYAKYTGFMYPEANCEACEPCGEGGTLQHFPVFSEVTDGYFDVSGETVVLNGTVDTSYGYRYSVWFGGTWEDVPYPARRLQSFDCANSMGGLSEGGYYQIFLPDGSLLDYNTYSQLGELNEYLSNTPTCVSVVAFSYGESDAWVSATFEEL